MSAIPQMPGLTGQVQVMSAGIDVATVDQTGQRALVIKPAGTALAIVVPMDDAAARQIGGALLAKHVVLPETNGEPPGV